MEDNINQPLISQIIQPPVVQRSLKLKIKDFFGNFWAQKKNIIGSVGSLALIAFLAAGVILVQQRQGGNARAATATVSLSTSNANPKVNDTFVVAVGTNTQGLSMSGANIEVKYDPNILEATAISAGTFLPLVFINGNLATGIATITVGSNPGEPKSGVGVLASVTFTAKSASPTSITLGPGTQVAAVGQSSNAAGTFSPLQLNGATPIPSGTPAPVSTITGTKVWTQYSPWHLDLYGTNMVSTSKARLFDTNGSQWGNDIGLYVGGGSTASSITLPSNNPPSGCNIGKTCTLSVQIVSLSGALSNKFDYTLPAVTGTPIPTTTPSSTPTSVPSPTPTPAATTPPTITSVKLWTQYDPWHLDIDGTYINSSLKARLIDTNGSAWGGDIGLYISSPTRSSIQLPSNSPPSGCNVGKSCTIGVYLVTSTGALSNKFDVTLPAK